MLIGRWRRGRWDFRYGGHIGKSKQKGEGGGEIKRFLDNNIKRNAW